MNYEIKHRFKGVVLFSLECDSLKLCLQAAVDLKADLSGADLRDAYLRCAYLRCADLSGADLRGADLSGADLRDANLRCADLSDANLSCADLRDANLSCAYLRCADLSGADLRDAYLRCADLSGAKEAAQLGQPNGWHAWTYLDKEGKQRVRVGCQDKTIADGRLYWAGKEDRREVMAALDYAEAIGTLRGWAQ